ncbi:MAG: YfcE family phosphodiesterase [Candidatus Altiarchaeota archaeon]|nr:YfcE family phosphodiesterase [Candidatus Altiarchaeota archaeon]
MKILVLGDTHIPKRASGLNPDFIQLFKEIQPDRIIFTGDATEYSILFFLDNLAPTYSVKGNADRLELPKFLSIKLKNTKFFIIHGHQAGRGNYSALYDMAHGHDVLVCGHTHKQETFKGRDMVVVNPGSATGAWAGDGSKPDSSFSLIKLGTKMEITEYRSEKNGIKIKRISLKDKAQAQEEC